MSSKVVNLTEITDPAGSDIEYHVDNPGGTPLDRKVYSGNKNLLPDGYMKNGRITVTVASNNITVSLKTSAGATPSATDPVSVWINGTYRRVTAATTVTKNAGTNWFTSGSTTLATKEIDYFVYLIWNTTPATDIMDIGFARIPNGRVYSDFSGTTTNEKFLAFGNASTPTSTNDVAVVARFAATLSATASFNWSVPTFTNLNLIQHPIFETRWLTFVPAWTGSGSLTYATVTVDDALYKFSGEELHMMVATSVGTAGGTTNTTISTTIPFTAGFTAAIKPAYGWINNAGAYGVGLVYASAAALNFRLYNSGNYTLGSVLLGGYATVKY